MGWKKPGIIRAISATVKVGANRDTILQTTKIPRTSSMTFLRFIPENNNGIVGPAIETAREEYCAKRRLNQLPKMGHELVRIF
ncbi:hypothetical protein ASF12_16835 [Paenibacillus sp. Leaf72]|nr:hypothetical protein ASF12_16835 [Paenibacillus sp. Leaf72]